MTMRTITLPAADCLRSLHLAASRHGWRVEIDACEGAGWHVAVVVDEDALSTRGPGFAFIAAATGGVVSHLAVDTIADVPDAVRETWNAFAQRGIVP